MADSIEQQLRAHLKRKLRHGHGHCQITVRRLVASTYPRMGAGYRHAEESDYGDRHALYTLAAELCEEAGGEFEGTASYCRNGLAGSVASRVYQF